MNALQQIIMNEAITLHKTQFSERVSIEEFQKCAQEQYSPGEFIRYYWGKDFLEGIYEG